MPPNPTTVDPADEVSTLASSVSGKTGSSTADYTTSTSASSPTSRVLAYNRGSSRRSFFSSTSDHGDKDAATRRSTTSNEILAPSTTSASKTKKATRDMTINKLRFYGLGLIGRSDETTTLREIAKRAKDTGGKELILISGESGTGKTVLAKTIENEKTNQGLFAATKFDLKFRDSQVPYAGIVGACREICRQLLLLREVDEERFQTVCQEIQQVLGSDQSLLASMVSGMDEILDIKPQRRRQRQQAMQEKMNRTVYAFQRFFQKLCALFPKSVMIFFDDCQWADFTSLHLLETLLSDDQIEGLVVLGCYRSEEVFDAHMLSQTIRNLQAKANDTFHISRLYVGNLQEHQVQEFVMELLSMDKQSQIDNLATLCHKKTMGNAFFLKQFLSHIHEEALLIYNFGLMKWTWDEQEIAIKVSATDNVLDLLKKKMELLDPEVNELLTVLACLGSDLPDNVVAIVWSDYCDANPLKTPQRQFTLNSLLDAAVEEGFLEHHPALSIYQFVHDKVHECCLEATDPLHLPVTMATIGRVVLAQVKQGTLEEQFLFTAVNLMNESLPPEDEKDRVTLGKLNAEAAQNAAGASSFVSASQYIKKCLDLLPDSRWSDELYTFTLNTYSLGAEVEACMGWANLETMNAYCDEVLVHAQSEPDKFRAYNVRQESALMQNQHEESVRQGMEILKKLGYRFPKRASAIELATIFRVVGSLFSLKKRTVEEIDSLPISTDTIQRQIMHVLDKTVSCCYLANDKRLPLVIIACLQITLKHGLSDYSAVAYALYGMILASLGEIEGASRVADCALAIIEKIDCRSAIARVLFLLNAMLRPWFLPYQDCRRALLNGYNAGLCAGDVENGMWCIAMYITMGFQAGVCLTSLEADTHIYVKQATELRQLQCYVYTSMFQSVVQELTGTLDSNIGVDKTTLPGFKELTTVQQFQTLDMERSRLCAIMGHHSEGAELSIKRRDNYAKDSVGLFWNIGDPFYRAISLFHVARDTKKKKFLKLAKKQRAIIKKLAKSGNPNVSHYECILDAESAAISGRADKVEELYQKGVVMAARSGFLMDAALGSERCAEFLLSQKNDQGGGAFRMKEAVRYYTEWGAHRKVQELEKRRDGVLPGPQASLYQSPSKQITMQQVSVLDDEIDG
ncbi:Transcriptional regulator [Seminavis robusta]|uniref:Transcriptional regulator n=1 Tax=Seminavis robusta TaxID=568900 RepID=A0A9N8E7U5_9STRA|nr:Transcriptional regulator [Seminavis robusta]|eukprot:Sro638_g179610.1 Transcriptional regulator (1140) ;mRNA; f:30218-33637